MGKFWASRGSDLMNLGKFDGILWKIGDAPKIPGTPYFKPIPGTFYIFSIVFRPLFVMSRLSVRF